MARVNCLSCGKEFYIVAAKLQRGWGKYCSLTCRDIAAHNNAQTQGETRQCPMCGKEFYAQAWAKKRGWLVYCSRQCLDRSKVKGEMKRCHHCGKEIYRSQADIRKSRSQLFFCDHSCRISWTNSVFSGEKHPNWKQGESAYRDILLRSGVESVCRRCGITDLRVLAVHHLDRNRANNRLENLAWLCHSCHYLVHHYPEEMDAFMATLQTKLSAPRSSDPAPSSE